MLCAVFSRDWIGRTPKQRMEALMQVPAMMRCDRLNMTLTAKGCARLFLSAQQDRPAKHEGRYACLTCAIGASNAGVSIPATAGAVEAMRTLCPRCRRRSDRIIRGRFCVSCYNREREVRVGRNSKGNRPTLADVLHPVSVAVIEPGRTRVVTDGLAAGIEEILIGLAKRVSGTIAFGRSVNRAPALAGADVGG